MSAMTDWKYSLKSLTGWLVLMGILFPHLLPGQSPPFTDEAAARGLDLFYITSVPDAGAGLAAVDLDQDGDADLVITGLPDQVLFLENDGNGYFTDRTADVNLPPMPTANAVAAGDPDGDGDLDILILCWGQADYLLRNDGDFQFTDIAEQVGLTTVVNGSGAAFADLNGDNWLDLLIVASAPSTAGGPESSHGHLFYNNGDGTFQESLDPIDQITNIFVTFQGLLQDFDLDGDLDIYLSNDKGCVADYQNYILENSDPLYIDQSDFGAGVSICSMGVAVADVNLDGLMDIFCTNVNEEHPLLLNEGDFNFVNATDDYGLGYGSVGWGTFFFDYGLDGDLDLFILDSMAPNLLYEQQGLLDWVNVAADVNLDGNGLSFCAVPLDVDLDGDIDLATQDCLGYFHLYIHPDEGNGNFIRLDPVAPFPNHFAVGSRIELRNDTGDLFFASQRGGGQYYRSEGEFIFQHGLGDAETVAQLTVVFPGGVSRTLTDLPANHTWKLYHPDLLGDANRNGVIDLEDCSQFLLTAATGFNPGAELFDFDGDSELNASDLETLLDLYDGFLLDCDSDGIVDLMELFLGTATDSNGDGIPDECSGDFIRGDVNIDLMLDISDPIKLLSHLFFGDSVPCFAATDNNHDGLVNIADPVSLLGFLFNSGAAPDAPFPDCGNTSGEEQCLISGCP